MMPTFDAIKASVKEVERQLMKGSRINTIAGFAAVRKEIKRLRKLVLERQRNNIDPITVKLQHQFCLRRLQELQYEAISRSLRIPATRKGYGLRTQRAAPAAPKKGVQWQDLESAFQKRLRTGIIINQGHRLPEDFLAVAMKSVKKRLANIMSMKNRTKMPAVSINFIFTGMFELPTKEDEETGEPVQDMKTLAVKNITITAGTPLDELLHEQAQTVIAKIETFEREQSGWRLVRPISLQASINKHEPLPVFGSAYVALPPALENNPALLNIRNTDRRCFLWCLMAVKYDPTGEPTDPNSYPQDFYSEFDLRGLEFPMPLKKIHRFEKQNPTYSFTVFGLEKPSSRLIGPLYHSKETRANHVNLLLVQKGKNNLATHYVLIKDLSKLVTAKSDHHKKVVCNRCLNYFYSRSRLNAHEERCNNFRACRTTTPSVGSPEATCKFQNYKALLRSGFAVYADFECLTEAVEDQSPTPSTRKYQRHVPYSCAYQVVCSFDKTLSTFGSYRGEDCAMWFINQMRMVGNQIRPHYYSNNKKPMHPMTTEQSGLYDRSTSCTVCKDAYTADNPKVRHHDHLTGEFLAPVCNICNLQIKISPTLPIFFHNLSRYDLHLFIDCLSYDDEPINVIPNTTEEYISVTKRLENGLELRFLDSYRFMASSLDSLAKDLQIDDLKFVKQAFPNPKHFDLARRKGVFPYDYVNSWDVLKQRQLPPRQLFFSKIRNEHISADEYERAQTVWQEFECTDLGNYSDLYLQIDVLLLADIFENFRNLCLTNYGLDACAFFTAPGLAFSAALKITGVRLDLLTDIDMVLYFESAIRGGITQVVHRYAESNNKFLIDSHDPQRPTSYLMYLDANNLYGWASVQPLPTGEFRWLDAEEISTLECAFNNRGDVYPKTAVHTTADGERTMYSPRGCYLEVDLDYPCSLHNEHADLPFCPESKLPPHGLNKKLMTTLEPKRKYILHVENLRQALNHGLKLVKIWRVLEFSQRPWLKEFIMLNTKLRTLATTPFGKGFFKLINNANFGKTMENVRKYRTIKLVSTWKRAREFMSRPEFKSFTIFRERLVAIELWPTEILFNKPLYTGAAILDLSKTLMYSFHYDYIRSPRVSSFFTPRLCYMDTDSFIYLFTLKGGQEEFPPTIYDIIRRDCHEFFDTSDYPAPNIHAIPSVNKKVIGKFKDELNGQIISHFIALRPKLYLYKVDGKEPVKKAKGVGGTAVRDLTFRDYHDALFKDQQKFATFNTIRSRKHCIYSESVTKLALDRRDNKRYVSPDNVFTIPWGHYQILDDDDDNPSTSQVLDS